VTQKSIEAWQGVLLRRSREEKLRAFRFLSMCWTITPADAAKPRSDDWTVSTRAACPIWDRCGLALVVANWRFSYRLPAPLRR
jgi:hypothetical protein